MINKLSVFFTSLLLLLIIFADPTQAFAAPKIFFDPSTITVVQNNEFTIQLKIDAQSNQVIGSDVVVSYAGTDLDITSVTSGSYFPQFQYADNASGRLELHGYVTSMYQGKTGAGTLATLKFKSSKSTGSSALTMSCDGSGNDTNMLSNSGQNILSCNSSNQVALTYSGSSTGSTNTPTPTSTQNQGGNQNNIPSCSSIAANLTNVQGTPQAISFTCSGTDQSGDVNGAEFTFGDGTKQMVEKNVGTSGSISTTHTYTSIGTFGASCRVRDNNYVFSSVPSGCKQNITIRPKPTSMPSSGSITIITTTPTQSAGNTALIAATPTIPVVSIISVTPYPTLILMPSPTLYPPEETSATSSRFWWIVGGVVSLLLAFLLLRRKKSVPPTGGPPPQMPPIIVTENTAEPPEPPPAI